MGLAILSTLLATALAARGRLVRQAADAERRRHATVAADALLARWWRDPDSLPRAGEGGLPADHLWWRTSVRQDAEATELDGEVVRLEITSRPTEGAAGASATTLEPLARVEILLPLRTEATHAAR